MDETTKTNPVETAVTDPKVENAAESEKNLNTFQKFLSELFNGKKDEQQKNEEPAKGEEKPKPTTKTYTEEEFTVALEASKQKLVAEAAEQERLSKLSPEEKEKATVTAAQAENARLQAELTKRDLRAEAVGKLSTDGYPVGLADMLDYSDKASMQKSLDGLLAMYSQSIKDGVNEKLRGKTPLGLGGAANAENALKDQIARNIRNGL